MKVAVVDCGSGNLASVTRAIGKAAADTGRAVEVEWTADPDRVARADRVVLPGQGAFAECARGLAAVDGLRESLIDTTARGTPFLGICVGMQLMAEQGLEHGATAGFGWIRGRVTRMRPGGHRLPQMGWNELEFPPEAHRLLNGVDRGDHAYFVHSYALSDGAEEQRVATTEYGGPVVAMVAAGNRAGTQFHVEKSQRVGLRILGNFLGWEP